MTRLLRDVLARPLLGAPRDLEVVSCAETSWSIAAWVDSIEDCVVRRLVLVDLDLHGDEGERVLTRLRSDPRSRDTAVVVTTSRTEPAASREEWLPGEVWLPKPFALEDLRTAVALALARLVAPAVDLVWPLDLASAPS